MSNVLRLFVAVELPAEALDLLAAVQKDLTAARGDVKWSRPQQIHLTLKFLGDLPPNEVATLSAALDKAASLSPACASRLAAIGAFPTVRRPRVVWAGLEEPSGRLLELQQRVDEATKYLTPVDPRGFAPHLTLGRVHGPKNLPKLAAAIEAYRLAATPEIPISEIVLVQSVLGRDGPTYTTLHRSALATG